MEMPASCIGGERDDTGDLDAAAAARSNAAATRAAQVTKLTAEDRVGLEGDDNAAKTSMPEKMESRIGGERDDTGDLGRCGSHA